MPARSVQLSDTSSSCYQKIMGATNPATLWWWLGETQKKWDELNSKGANTGRVWWWWWWGSKWICSIKWRDVSHFLLNITWTGLFIHNGWAWSKSRKDMWVSPSSSCPTFCTTVGPLEGSVFMFMLVSQDWNCLLNDTWCQIKSQAVIRWLKKLLCDTVVDIVEIWLP